MEGQSFNDMIKGTHEYQMFTKEFRMSQVRLKRVFDQFVENDSAPLDLEQLLSLTDSVLAEGRNGFHIIHMMQCMRNVEDITYVHSLNVALMCSILADRYRFTQEDRNVLVLAGLLHDFGKLKMPSAIAMKPDALTDEEFKIMKEHPKKGFDVLMNQDIDIRIKLAALMHHEKCDGSGYPSRLTSNSIVDFAKIVAIADTYDAMTSARIYRGAICPFEVISVFEGEGYQKYDPKFLIPFLQGIVDTYIHCNVRLNDGQQGEVVFNHPQALSRPMVQTENGFVDLAAPENKDLKIVELL